MKKSFWLIAILSLLGFMGCGSSDSSDEARDLQRKILNVVGIPQEIVANICQDDNKNGFCETSELQAKIKFNREDSSRDIWNKISQTADGKYFLETYDSSKPILLVLKDSTVKFDNGEFILNFNGFETDLENEEKELSILESMVDNKNIAPTQVSAIKKLDNPKAQEKFYNVLLDDLKTNINTLRTKGLDSKTTMSANIQEMAEELLTSGVESELPNKINSCGVNESCFNQEIEQVSKELLITEQEAQEIIEMRSNINQAPTVNAGEDRTATINESIKLTANAKDSDGSISTYEWKEGDKLLATTASFEYRATTVGKHLLTLTVVDNDGAVTKDTLVIIVNETVIDNNDGKRLSKIVEYDSEGIKTSETLFFYENGRVIKWINESIETNQTYTALFQYEADKTTISYNNNAISWETLYRDNIINGWNFYYLNQLSFSAKVLKYDNNNHPIKVEQRVYHDGVESLSDIINYTYDDDYLIRYEDIDQSSDYFNSSETYDFSYDRNYECILFNTLLNTNIMFLSDEEYCMNWTTKKTTKADNNQTYTETQKITYDGKLPIQIDEYLYDEEMKKNVHSYSTFEYIN